MNYKETVSWLFEQLPMFQRIGKAAYKADLNNTIAILNALGNPENKIRAIHIAGTNGKGSVSHIIASVLQEAGYKIGLYTSPHLKDFRERIKINGNLIPEDKVVDFVATNMNVFANISSSFFEMTVGMAFDYFAAEEVDFAVIETGLGGRLDSTNLCKPVISIITNIGIDHTAFLGDTIEKIAVEKAGIIKYGIPVVVGRRNAETDIIFENACKSSGAPIFFAEDDMSLRKFQSDDEEIQAMDLWYKNVNTITNIKSPLMGNYQNENTCTALRAIELLRENEIVKVSETDICNGIESVVNNTGFYGRWQKLSGNPLTICDTGHNIDGIKAVVMQLMEQNYDNLHFVLGMVNDKDISKILSVLPKHANYYFCKPDIPRGLDADELAEQAMYVGLNGMTYSSVIRAYNSAINNAGINDLVFIGGSTFVLAEVV
ncbi:MAG: folylpolyglutamate synthase/dihydrofolate synthase family protein [Bacteroidota bacterium]